MQSQVQTTNGLLVRKSNERGHSNLGWLDTYHTFSFANYSDRHWEQFGNLRVLNEDRVKPGKGFGEHPHSKYEIFSYIIDGKLEHQDNLGNIEVLERGAVQFTTTGTGLSHSEYNHDTKDKDVHFLQMWVIPNVFGLKPGYQTKIFTDEQKKNRLCKLISPKTTSDNTTIKINQEFSMYASLLDKDQQLTHTFERSKGYIHVIMTNKGGSLKVNDVVLNEGDGLCINNVPQITITGNGEKETEFVLMDLD